MKNLLTICFCVFAISLCAQHKVGVRAGLNYSKFSGPLEVNETYGISNGFHFGINYTYLLPNKIGFRGEVLYIQRGTKQNYVGDSYYIINPIDPSTAESFVEMGSVDYRLNISTAYLSVPLTVQYRANRRWELFAGASLDFLIGPTGIGRVNFDSSIRPEDIRFEQSLDHNYGSDVAGEYNSSPRQTNIIIRVDGELVTIPKVIGGYYNFSNEQRAMGNRLNGFNSHLIGGVNYFINTGFYIGLRYEYGLLDMTNDAVDVSLGELDADENFIYRDDVDKPYTISVSFGFRF